MKAFMLFVGRSTAVQWGFFAVLAFVFSIAARVVLTLGGNPSACELLGFIGQVLCVTVILYTLRIVFNANVKSFSGYGFFHSLPNSASKFRQAIITSNALMILFSAMFTLMEWLLFGEFSVIFTVILLFMLGWINMFGNFSSVWIYSVPLLVMGFLYGFLSGFFDDNESGEFPSEVSVILLAAAAVFCVIGILKSVIASEKIWERDR